MATRHSGFVIVRMLFTTGRTSSPGTAHRGGRSGRAPIGTDRHRHGRREHAPGRRDRRGQMKFWNDFYDLVFEAGDRNGDGKQFMPTNDLNAPARTTSPRAADRTPTSTLAGSSTWTPTTHFADRGMKDVPVEPAYSGFHLSNLWASLSTTPTTSPASTRSSPNPTTTAWCATWWPMPTPAPELAGHHRPATGAS